MATETRNHGTVRCELVEYREAGGRVLICELMDGWHVVEVYRPGAATSRRVFEELAEAREYARGLL